MAVEITFEGGPCDGEVKQLGLPAGAVQFVHGHGERVCVYMLDAPFPRAATATFVSELPKKSRVED